MASDSKYQSSGAAFSPCRTYRYALWRKWGPGERQLVVIGLNPSTADENVDDPTIRRCVGFAKREGCDGLVMLNLFAVRATDPRVMLAHPDPVGPENDATLRVFAEADTSVVLAAWGAHGGHRGRAAEVLAWLPAPVCLGRTKAGHPRHPLYVASSAPLISLTPTPGASA